MANLLSIAELCYRQFFPNPTPQTAQKLDEFIETARGEYAYQTYLMSRAEKRENGEWEVPASLLRQADLDVKDNKADLSTLSIFNSLEHGSWIQSIGSMSEDCKYIRQSANLNAMLDEDYVGNAKPYLIVGNTALFPMGVHSSKVPIIYASNGEDIPDEINVDDALAGIIRRSLMEIYQLKYPVDVTNNNNSNN